MKVVLTGANGFMGKNLQHHLKDYGVDFVRLLDLHITSSAIQPPISFSKHEIDLADPSLSELIEPEDMVIHMAWRSNPVITASDISKEEAMNWAASINLIDACIRKKAKLIFISSGGAVYGHPEYDPIDEKHPTRPISAYGQLKLKVEQAILEAHKHSGLKYLIFRPSNLYGPGYSLQKGLGVIGHWVEMIKQNKPLKMVGDGMLTRDFIHADDLSRGILQALPVENEILNLGSGIGISLLELKQLFEKIISGKIKAIHLDSREHDVKKNILSIDKLHLLTGWSPMIPLEAGIRELLQ